MHAVFFMLMLTVGLVTRQGDAPARAITDAQIREAIEMGRTANVPIVQIGTWLGVSKGDFNVFIERPMARIAAAASNAYRQYRPFEPSDVAPDMEEPVYRVIIKRDFDSSRYQSRPLGHVKHVVLQPRRAKGMDGVIQPLREYLANGEAFFDRFPEGEFDVVIATEYDVQRYNVSPKQRGTVQ